MFTNETLLTLRARERLLSSVSSHVNIKSSLACETLSTLMARIRLLSGVRSHVGVKVSSLWENPSTLSACVRFLSSMNFRWFLRYSLILKLFPHWGHRKGFSPVWTLMCTLRLPWRVKLFPHSWQAKGFSPVWTFICSSSCSLCEKLLHTEGICMVFDLPELNSFHIHGLWKTFLHLKHYEVSDSDASPPLHSEFHFPVLSLKIKTVHSQKSIILWQM